MRKLDFEINTNERPDVEIKTNEKPDFEINPFKFGNTESRDHSLCGRNKQYYLVMGWSFMN